MQFFTAKLKAVVLTFFIPRGKPLSAGSLITLTLIANLLYVDLLYGRLSEYATFGSHCIAVVPDITSRQRYVTVQFSLGFYSSSQQD